MAGQPVWIDKNWIAVDVTRSRFYRLAGLPGANPQPRPLPAHALASPSPTADFTANPSVTAGSPAAGPVASPGIAAAPAPDTASTPESIAPFKEKTEVLKNSDVELRLTNRGGGISEARVLNHKGENGPGHGRPEFTRAFADRSNHG